MILGLFILFVLPAITVAGGAIIVDRFDPDGR
jgi:hypothetical protein